MFFYVPCCTCTALPSCQHCVDGIPTDEVLYVSDSHIVTSHADDPLEKRVRGREEERVWGGGGRGTLEVTGSNTVSDKNHACRNDGGEGRVEGQSSVALDKLQ